MNPRATAATSSPGAHGAAALLVVLIVAVVLSGTALGLHLITQDEALIGGNQRRAERLLAMSEVGVEASILATLFQVPTTTEIRLEPPSTKGLRLLARPDPTRVLGLSKCALCMANESSPLRRARFAASAASQERALVESGPAASERRLDTTFELYPWPMDALLESELAAGESR